MMQRNASDDCTVAFGRGQHEPLSLTQRRLLGIGLPLLTLLALTVLFRCTDADRAMSRLFYQGSFNAWWGLNSPLCMAVYRYSMLPAYVLGIGGAVLGVAGFLLPSLRGYRAGGIFLACMLVIGPGLLVNSVFKPFWHRPRPKHLVDFGGELKFMPVWSRASSPKDSASFPSGHASMGFVLMAPAFLFYRRRWDWAVSWLALGTAAGVSIGLARIAQGAHFASDVLWSGGVIFLTGLFLTAVFERYGWLGESPRHESLGDQDANSATRPIAPAAHRLVA